MGQVGPPQSAANRAQHDAHRHLALAFDIVAELEHLLALSEAAAAGLRQVLLQHQILRGGGTQKRPQREHHVRILIRFAPAELPRALEHAHRNVVQRLTRTAVADEVVHLPTGVTVQSHQQAVLAEVDSQRFEGVHTRQQVTAIARHRQRQTLLDQARAERTAVGLEHDFARDTPADGNFVLGAHLINVGVLNSLVLAHHLLDVGKQHAGAFVSAGVEVGSAAAERGTRQSRTPVVERWHHRVGMARVNRTRQMHVKGFDEVVAAFVGKFRPLQRGFEQCVDHRQTLRHL